MLPSNGPLAFLDGVLQKLDDLSAPDAYQMVMMAATVEFEHRLTVVKVVAAHQSGAFKLCDDPIHGGETNLLSALQQRLVNVLGTQVMVVAGLEHVENLDPRQGDLEARLLDPCFVQPVYPLRS